jgi:hypothetical protein
MTEQDEAACRFYDTRYDFVFERLFERSEKHELGDRQDRQCRFCGKKPPEVSFGSVAHAIPEALGNRGLTSAYECDACNNLFGKGIEDDLGKWTMPVRTMARIRGKKGVPTLRESSKGGWRVEFKDGRLNVRSYEDSPIYEVDEVNKRVVFTLRRDPYTPVAVMKAFVKIGLTLLPNQELPPFATALAWVRETDHSRKWIASSMVIHTMQNGPMPNDRLMAAVLRRKPSVVDVPYAFLLLGYGNDVFQIVLPAPVEDAALLDVPLNFPPFPTPDAPDPTLYGRARPQVLDLTGCDVVRGETKKVAMRYAVGTRLDPEAGKPDAARETAE